MTKELTAPKYSFQKWLACGMLLVGATAPFLMSWATPFETWARHQINSFPPSMWVYILLIALYPIGAIDFFNRFLFGKIRREAFYAIAFTVPLLLLLFGTSLSPLPAGERGWSMGENLRYGCVCGAMGTVIGIGIFLLLSIVGLLPGWLWRVIKKVPKAGTRAAPLTLRSMVFWIAIVAINLAIFLGDSELLTQTRPSFLGLDQAAITVGVCLVVAIVCYFLGRWLRRTRHFISSSFVLATLPILATIGCMLFSPWPIWSIQEGLFHFIFLWVIYSLIIVVWNLCVGATETPENPEAKDGFLRLYLSRPLLWLCVAAWLLSGGWLAWHLIAPNPSEAPEDIRNSIAKRLSPDSADNADWVDIWNQQHGLGLAPEKNGVVDLLRINFESLAANRMIENWESSHRKYFDVLGLKSNEYDSWLKQIENSRLILGDRRIHRLWKNNRDLANWWHALPDNSRDLLRATTLKELRKALQQGKLASWKSRVENGQILREDDELVNQLFSDEGYPPGASFLESVSDDLATIRGLGEKDFFWPLVRIAPDSDIDSAHYNHEVDSLAFMTLVRPMKLLRMAAANDAGSNRMDAAIENCVAIVNLCRPKCTLGAINTTFISQELIVEMHLEATQTMFLVAISPYANNTHRKKLMEMLDTLKSLEGFTNDQQTSLLTNLMFDRYVTTFRDSDHPDRLSTMAFFRPWSHMIRMMPRAINWSDFHDLVVAKVDKDATQFGQMLSEPDAGRRPNQSPSPRNPARAWLLGGIDAKTKELANRYGIQNEERIVEVKRVIAMAQFGIAIENYRKAHGGAYPKDLADSKEEVFASLSGKPNQYVWGKMTFEETDQSFRLYLPRRRPILEGPSSEWMAWPK